MQSVRHAGFVDIFGTGSERRLKSRSFDALLLLIAQLGDIRAPRQSNNWGSKFGTNEKRESGDNQIISDLKASSNNRGTLSNLFQYSFRTYSSDFKRF